MKPYLLVAGDFVKTGGMDRANLALADYLARQGKQVHLVAYRVAAELLAYPNVTFHQVTKIANSYLLSAPLLDWVGRFQARRVTAAGVRILVNGGNCLWGDVNWVHYVHAAYKADNPVGMLRKIKGTVSYGASLKGERRALQSARLIIANSDRTKRDIIDKLGVPEERVHRVYYGIDPTTFYPANLQERIKLRQRLGWPNEKPIAVFIGALGDRRKGFDTLFAAWERLCAEPDWDADLVTIGVGAELPQWQCRAAEAGIASRIHFLGFRSDVPDLLRAADCLVAPTRYEAYGLAVHEALCCGLPALVSATAGVAERYSSQLEDLLLPNPQSVDDLTERLRQWRFAIEQYKKILMFFSEVLRNYTWDEMAIRILSTISKNP